MNTNVTEMCDWGNLMSVLSSNDSDVKNITDDILSTISNVTRDTYIHNLTVLAWYTRSKLLYSSISITYHKRLLQVDELSLKATQTYRHIINNCPTDESLLAIKRLIDDGPNKALKKISGRTIDTLVTRFPRYHNVCYYLDVTDKDNAVIVPYSMIRKHKNKEFILFDIGSSYRKKMHQFSKAYFDCFGRGDEVSHISESGVVINISLCQYTFFIWASRFKVFEFLQKELDRVIVVRKHCQKTTYRPKHLKKKISCIITNDLKKSVIHPPIKRLCKSIIHEKLVMKPSKRQKRYNIPSNHNTTFKLLCDYRNVRYESK